MCITKYVVLLRSNLRVVCCILGNGCLCVACGHVVLQSPEGSSHSLRRQRNETVLNLLEFARMMLDIPQTPTLSSAHIQIDPTS